MAYNKKEIKEKALMEIDKSKLVFIEDVCAKLPITKKTFYLWKFHECNDIKREIERNKINLKVGLRKKMYESDLPVGWIALYKLIGSEEECHRLNGSKQENTNLNVNHNIDVKSIFGELVKVEEDNDE